MIINQKNTDILKQLSDEAIISNKLYMTEIDITNACNCNCSFCFQGSLHKNTDNELSYEELYNTLKELREMGCYFISFSGGEPFCRKDFLEILSVAKKMGFFISFVSTMHIPTIGQMIELETIGVSRILVSFHSINPTKYSNIFHTTESNYWTALNNIDFMIKAKMPINISVTVYKDNYMELDNIVNFFMDRGLSRDRIRFNTLIHGFGNKVDQRFGAEFIQFLSEHKSLLGNIEKEKRDTESNFLCSAGRTACIIKSTGEVIPCGFLNIIAGNIREKSIKDIWSSAEIFLNIRNMKTDNFIMCTKCSYCHNCHVCIADNYNENANFFKPSDSFCELNKGLIDLRKRI